MSQIIVAETGITELSVHAILTLVNKHGIWYSEVDKAIKRVAGDFYHDQLREVLNAQGLSDRQVAIAYGNRSNHTGQFDNVVFVVDDFKSPLSELVYFALLAARSEGYTTIALPVMRIGDALGVFERSVKEVIEQTLLGIVRFLEKNGVNVIYIVTEDPVALAELYAIAQFQHIRRSS